MAFDGGDGFIFVPREVAVGVAVKERMRRRRRRGRRRHVRVQFVAVIADGNLVWIVNWSGTVKNNVCINITTTIYNEVIKLKNDDNDN